MGRETRTTENPPTSLKDRDERLESRYTLSPAFRAVVGEHRSRSMLATIAANVSEIAELYQGEAGREHDDLEGSVTSWLRRHLGAEPEIAIVGLITFEVGRRIEGEPRHHELFANYADEKRWEGAARVVMASPDFDDLGIEQRFGHIVAAAGETLGHGLRSIAKLVAPILKPRRYLSETAHNERMDRLRAQARALQGEL